MLAGLGEGQSRHTGTCLSHMAKELPQGWRPLAKSLGWCLQHHRREIPSNARPGEPEQCQFHLWGQKWENRVGQLGNAVLHGALGFGKEQDRYRRSKVSVHLWDYSNAPLLRREHVAGGREHSASQPQPRPDLHVAGEPHGSGPLEQLLAVTLTSGSGFPHQQVRFECDIYPVISWLWSLLGKRP